MIILLIIILLWCKVFLPDPSVPGTPIESKLQLVPAQERESRLLGAIKWRMQIFIYHLFSTIKFNIFGTSYQK